MEMNPRIVALGEGRLQIDAPAKLNLGLRVFPARADGFHDLETWMVPTSWHDTLFFTPTKAALRLEITGRSEGVPGELDKNLVGKGAVRLAEAGGVPPTGVVRLHKVLPPGGGIGGGSSDAAAALVMLNHAWGVGFSEKDLEGIAGELGSDVPFFVKGRAALCTGRGEVMTPLLLSEPLFAVLIIPPRGCPTKEVYQAFDRLAQQNSAPTDWQKLSGSTAEELNGLLVNDLAMPAYEVARWLKELQERAAAVARQRVHVTGSGSTLFTLAGSSVAANEIQQRLSACLPPEIGVIPAQIIR